MRDARLGLEEISGKPTNKIGRRAARAAVLALLRGRAAVNYYMDYLGG
jgi:hypothetical protein